MPSDSHTNTVNLGLTGSSTQNATRDAIVLGIAVYEVVDKVFFYLCLIEKPEKIQNLKFSQNHKI